MAFAKFEENRFRIDGEIAENHAILVNLTAGIITKLFEMVHEKNELKSINLRKKHKSVSHPKNSWKSLRAK